MRDLNDRGVFLNIAGVFEGGLALLALGAGWAIGVDPLRFLRWDWQDAASGSAAAVPIFVLLLISYRLPFGRMREITQFLTEALGPPLSACRWYDLILLAALAGFAEELLFRGLIQVWLEGWGWGVALAGSNLLFGLAHCITPLYAVLAGLIGVYLGLLMDAGDERNLLTPMVTHALYDYLAFIVVARRYRTELPPVNDMDVEIP